MAFDITQNPADVFLGGLKKIQKLPAYNPLTDPDLSTGDILTWQWVTRNEPIKTPVQTSPTDSLLYKGLSKFETPINAVTNSLPWYEKRLQDVGNTVTDITQKAGNFLQNTPEWLDQAKSSGKYLTDSQLTDKINNIYKQVPDATDEEIAQALSELKKEWYYFEGVNDKITNNPLIAGDNFIANKLVKPASDILWWATKMAWQVTGWYTAGLGKTMEWATNLFWDDTTKQKLWASQLVSWATDTWMWILTASMPWASSIFNTKAVEKSPVGTVFNKIWEWSQAVTKAGLDMTWLDPNSEEYQNYLNAWTKLWQVWTTYWLFKWAEKSLPYVKTGVNKATEAITPYVEPIIKKTWELASKIPNPLPTKQGVRNVWNQAAEAILSSQWKLDKKTRDVMQQNIGENGAKFALERDIVWKDIESTADNAWAYKVAKIQEKMDAVKNFWDTQTPDVARNVANVLKNDIIDSVEKSYGKGTDTMKVLEENHPELAQVLKLTDDVINSSKIDYLKLEQLKELHDYLNPENIQYDISGKPISETKNILSAWKRGKLQQLLEEAGQKNGVDIKWINKDIQGAYQLEKWLNNSVSRIQNLNILGLGDTQVAMISSILGGAPWAIGSLLLKKWLQSEWFRAWLSKKLYTKTPKNVTTNNMNPSGTSAPPITRMGRIMNHNNNSTTHEVVEPSNIPWSKKTTKEYPYGRTTRIGYDKWVEIQGTPLLPAKAGMWKNEITEQNTHLSKISANTEAARYGWTWNERIESYINGLVDFGSISKEKGVQLAENILKSVQDGESKYKYVDIKKLENFISDLKWIKETLPAQKTKTPLQIYDKLQKMANDWRFWEKSWNTLAEEFKKLTWKDVLDVGYENFTPEWTIKIKSKKSKNS